MRALRLGAGAGAATVALLGTGDLVGLSLLLALSAGGLLPGLAAALAALATVARWGTTSLDAVAGAQAVLGTGVGVGPEILAASVALAAGALVLAAPRGPAGAVFGVAAGMLVAGPAPVDGPALATRLAAALLGAVIGLAAGRWLPRTPARWAAVAAGAAALALGMAA